MSLFTVALTGGVASGKSEVAQRFAVLGAEVVDADMIARALVAPGQPLLAEIVAVLGEDILTADGSLDRAAVRARIFADPVLRERLEAILHPSIWRELQQRASVSTAAYAMLVIPLLIESGLHSQTDRVLLVDVPRETQLRRLVLRDRIAVDLADAMLAAQATREERLAAADDVLDNSGHPDALDDQVARLHVRYLELAHGKRTSS
ncbi:MAG: dephospho-CoA kinase [Rhodanobacteraceae bacterium]